MDAVASAVDAAQRTLPAALPRESELVLFDGFDQLDKERARSIYAGQTWQRIAERLDQAGADFGLEEWSVLEPTPRAYYLQGLLQHLAREMSKPEPDGQFVSEFFYTLGQVAARSPDNLTVGMITSLIPLAATVINEVAGVEHFGVWQDDVLRSVLLFRELAARGG